MEYTLKRSSRSRSIRISLNNAGEVVVLAPKFALKFMIDQFVNAQQPWIVRQQRRLSLRKTANPTLSWDEKVISFLGKLYSIEFEENSSVKVRFERGKCLVAPVTGQAMDVKVTLFKWLKRYAEAEIYKRTREWSEKMETSFGTVRFGQQSSRWGSCTGSNNLRFNWRLIHFPTQVVDYVVIHELAHTVHHDHSDKFWKLVETYCPSWKEQRKFLKRQMVVKEM